MKRLIVLTVIVFNILILAGCGKQQENRITFSDSGIEANVSGASVSGTTLTITEAGSYTLTGSCAQGNIIIDTVAGKAVYLYLDNFELSCSETSPIQVKQCPLLVISANDGTQNILTDNHTYSELFEQGESANAESLLNTVPTAAIDSRSPILISGNTDADKAGKLVINANCYNGISCSDTVTVNGGILNIVAKNHAIRGKDFVVVSSGVLTLKAGNDGIKSTNTEDAGLGYINITGGVIYIQASDEAIYAPHSVNFKGGNVTIKSKNTGIKTEGVIAFEDGNVDIIASDDPILCESKILKPTAMVTANGSGLTE